MRIYKKISSAIGKVRHKVIATMLAIVLPAPTWASDWTLGASITASETYTDNVTLSTASEAKSDWITAVTPTLTAKKNGARFKADARYSMQNLFYAQDAARNKTYHQLNARANTELFENEIYLDTTASISQAAISPLGASGVDNASATGNLTNVQALTVSPYWIHRFGSTAKLNARYTISDVRNSNSALASSTNNSTNVSLASGSAFGRVSWGLNFSDQTVDYQDRSDASFTTTSANLGYLVSTRVKITGTVGTENNVYASSSGAATGGSFWNTAVSWAPSTRTSLDLGVGHRYYGQSWNMAFKTRGIYSEWTADYNERVTTSNSQAGGVIPTTANDPTKIQTNQVFLDKRFGTGFTWKKGKSNLSFSAYRSVQEALETGQLSSVLNNGAFQNYNTIKQLGFNAGWIWQLTPLMNSSVTGGVSRSSFPDLSREDTTTSLQIGLNRTFSPRLSGGVSLRRQTRDSNQNVDYTENALSCSVTYAF